MSAPPCVEICQMGILLIYLATQCTLYNVCGLTRRGKGGWRGIDKCYSHRVHRVATVTFQHTFHDGEGGARLPPFTISTITYKVLVYAPDQRGQIHIPYFYFISTYMYSVVIYYKKYFHSTVREPPAILSSRFQGGITRQISNILTKKMSNSGSA